MDALDKLLSKPVRENAGQRTGNRYQYQYHWGLIKLLELFVANDDFMMAFEFADDIIVLDSSEEPQYIDFYQIKTNSKKNIFYWTKSELMKNGTKASLSIIERLIDNYNRYDSNVRSIQFVSNMHCKFDDISTKDYNPLFLESLSEADINKFKKQLCINCPQKNTCEEQCKTILSFYHSDLDIDSFKETSIGKVHIFLKHLYPTSNINDTALYNTLLTNIEHKSTYEGNITCNNDIIMYKSITRKDLQEQLNIIYNNSEFERIYSTVHTDLSKLYSATETKKIEKAFKDIATDMLDISNLLLQKIINVIRREIDELLKNELITDDNKLKMYVEKIVMQIYALDDTISTIYDKNHIRAIFFREWGLYGQSAN